MVVVNYPSSHAGANLPTSFGGAWTPRRAVALADIKLYRAGTRNRILEKVGTRVLMGIRLPDT